MEMKLIRRQAPKPDKLQGHGEASTTGRMWA